MFLLGLFKLIYLSLYISLSLSIYIYIYIYIYFPNSRSADWVNWSASLASCRRADRLAAQGLVSLSASRRPKDFFPKYVADHRVLS